MKNRCPYSIFYSIFPKLSPRERLLFEYPDVFHQHWLLHPQYFLPQPKEQSYDRQIALKDPIFPLKVHVAA